jgi:hypothetical protein
MSAFTRQLADQSGVQLNDVIDASNIGLAATNIDQIFGTTARLTRGRIDRAFHVDAGTLTMKCGPSASIQLSALNEAYTHIYQTLSNGANMGVISRLVPAAAVNGYMVLTMSAGSPPVGTWSTSTTAPSTYAIYLQHLDCHNDGVTVQINALQNLVSGVAQATNMVRLQILDNQTGKVLNGYDFTGSLVSTSVDEFGMSNYLPNVIAAQTDGVVAWVSASFTSVATNVAFYGNDTNGNPLWLSASLTPFTEGGTVYANSDYDAALNRLRYSPRPFGYLMSGGTQNTALLSKLLTLGYNLNVQCSWDIAGSLTPSAAITFYNSVAPNSRYSQCYWAPIMSQDPINGGSFYWGTSCDNIAMRCARNARTDSNGLAPKNYPVAGSAFPLSRVGMRQTYTPSDPELSSLADSRINPVIFVRYNNGGKFVFYDSLTGANSIGGTKLINVTEMSSSVDDLVTKYAQECLQFPMAVAIKRISKFLKDLFAATDSAGWTTPSPQGLLLNGSNEWTVAPNAQRPFDRVDINYGVHYDGTARAIYVQQTVSR